MKLRTIDKKKIPMFAALLLVNPASFATKNKQDINLGTHPWYLEYWVWITAGMVLGVLVIAALKGSIRVRR